MTAQINKRTSKGDFSARPGCPVVLAILVAVCGVDPSSRPWLEWGRAEGKGQRSQANH